VKIRQIAAAEYAMLQGEVNQHRPTSTPVVGRYDDDLDTPLHGSMLGLQALVESIAEFGVPARALLAGTGIVPDTLSDNRVRISIRQKIALFANALRLSPDPAIGLLAGRRQHISNLGVLGYALVSNATLGQAVDFGVKHVRLAGPVLEKSFRVEGDTAIFEGHDPIDLGELLPVACEFWFGSMQTLLSHVLGQPFQAQRLLLPYAAPPYAHRYEQIFAYPVEFSAPVMQWHFDASMLALPLPAANPVMAEVSASFCSRILEEVGGEPALVKQIKAFCLSSTTGIPSLEQMAEQLNLSTRTLQRRLLDSGCRYQDILEGVRRRLAIEFLERTHMPVEEIAERLGYSDASNFRKAFKKWTGRTPAFYRPRVVL
jgi:AraC-like DNA-binding protein